MSFFQTAASNRNNALLISMGGLLFLALSIGLSIRLGAMSISFSEILASFLSFEADNLNHQLVQEIRIPRACTAALAGAAFAVSGTVMQGLTRNPLADPSIIGINQGAGFAIALALAFLSAGSFWSMLGWSFAGSAVGAGLIVLLSSLSQHRLSPVTLTLAGAAISSLFSALSTATALYFQVAQDVSFWFAGGLSGAKWLHVFVLLPSLTIGFLLALSISRHLTVLAMGDDIATGLGQSAGRVRITALFSVMLLCGAAVAVSGTIGFVGLVVPHIVRAIVGVDYRYILPCSAIVGALLLVAADIGARMINPPFETPVGAVTALVGVPFFLYLARQKKRGL